MRSSFAAISLLCLGVSTAAFSQGLLSDELEFRVLSPKIENLYEQATGFRETKSRPALVNYTIVGVISGIQDGDTITIQGKGDARFGIRFSDMDTPETYHKAGPNRRCKCDPFEERPGQPGGRRATAALEKLISKGDVVRAECYELGYYGRPICHVFKDDLNINLEMIKAGWAWVSTNEDWVRDPNSYKAEKRAKKAKLGAWGLPDQVHPEQWRDDCWKAEVPHCPNAVMTE